MTEAGCGELPPSDHGEGRASARRARDPVNLPMIENWLEAIGDDNPVYTSRAGAAASSRRR